MKVLALVLFGVVVYKYVDFLKFVKRKDKNATPIDTSNAKALMEQMSDEEATRYAYAIDRCGRPDPERLDP